MQKVLAALITGAVFALVAGDVRAADKKVDVNGTWSWTQQGRRAQDGGDAPPPRKTTLKLKAEGEKLTGTLSQPAMGRQGGGGGAAGAPRETEITDGKIKGDEISFSVKREFQGNAIVTKYTGKVDGDKIVGKIEAPGRDGGEARSRDWTADREKAAADKK